MASEDRADRIKEAGLSSSNRSNEQDPNLGHVADYRRVVLNTLHQFVSRPVGQVKKKKHFTFIKTKTVIFGKVVCFVVFIQPVDPCDGSDLGCEYINYHCSRNQ